MTLSLVIISLILLALVFDFINGFHDAANSIATIVATETLTPRQAVVLACIFNIIGLFIFDLHIAATIGKGIVDPNIVDLATIFGALTGAIIWNLITWYYGLPSSSSHALIGGIIGSAVAKAGFDIVILSGITKVAIFIILSPIIGFCLAFILIIILKFCLKYIDSYSLFYRRLQIITCSLYSIGHGSNDAQKTAGVIFLILVAGGIMNSNENVPYWVAVISFIVMGLGTLAGGWRIVETMGKKLARLDPRNGVAAEAAGSTLLFLTSSLGIPVSTTHCITGSILGAGAADDKKIIGWKVMKRIGMAWIITIPCSAILSACFYEFILLF